MDHVQSLAAQSKRSITINLPSGSSSASSGCQHSPRLPDHHARAVSTIGDRKGSSRPANPGWEMQDYSDDALEDDEETGLTSVDKSKRRRKKTRHTRLDQRIAHDTHDEHDEKKLAYRRLVKESVLNFVLIAAWYSFSIGISVFNKRVLTRDKGDLPFPLFFTSLHMVIQFVLASTVLFFNPALRPRPAEPSTSEAQYQHVSQSTEEDAEQPQPLKAQPIMSKFFYLTRISPCGAATGLDIGLGNMSLKYISLTFYTMCKSSVLGFVLLFAFLFRLEKPSWKLAAIIATMATGVIMMVAGELAFNALGFILIMSASFFSGFRWSLTQILLIRNPATSNPFSSIFFLAPVMFLTLIIIAIPVEGPVAFAQGVQTLAGKRGVLTTIGILIFPGFLAFCMTASEFALLKRTSVVTLSVCGIFKEVLTITTAATVFGDELTVINFSGLAVTIVSIACYNYIKFRDMKADAKKDAHDTIQRRTSTLNTGDRPRSGPHSASDEEREFRTSDLIRNSLSAFPTDLNGSRRPSSASTGQSPSKRPENLE